MAQPGRTFLVECYLPGIAERDVAKASGRARQVVGELRELGREIAYLGALFVASDEVVFHQFAAPDAGIVAEASRMADLAFERVVESIDVGVETAAVGEVGQATRARHPAAEPGSASS